MLAEISKLEIPEVRVLAEISKLKIPEVRVLAEIGEQKSPLKVFAGMSEQNYPLSRWVCLIDLYGYKNIGPNK